MKQQIMRFWREEDGITALEYGILAAIVAGVIIAVFGKDLKDKVFDPLFTKLTDAVAATPDSTTSGG